MRGSDDRECREPRLPAIRREAACTADYARPMWQAIAVELILPLRFTACQRSGCDVKPGLIGEARFGTVR
jgi:hypothetical protein